MTKLLTMRQVGERLGHGYHWFRKRRFKLEREDGFPKPVRGVGLRWDPAAIDAWLAAQREPQGQTASRVEVTIQPPDYAEQLDRRAADIAGRMH